MNAPHSDAPFPDALQVASALATAAQLTPDGILLLDAADTIQWANPGAERLFGAALPGRDVWSLLDADARERLAPRVHDAMHATGRWNGTVMVRGADGLAQRRLSVLRLAGDAGAPDAFRWQLTHLDPFELREEELRAMVDALPIGVFLNAPDGQCLWVNHTYERLTGVPRSALLGNGWQQVMVGDQHAYRTSVGEALSTQGTFGPVEVRYRSAEGAERTASVRIRTLFDDVGQVRGHAGVVADITEIRDSRLQLATSEERLRTLLATIDEGIVMHDASGTICLWNASAERILGMTGDQLAGRTSLDPSWQAVDADGRPLSGEQHPAMVTLRTGQAVRDFVMGVRRGDAERRWIRVTSLPIMLPGADGREGVVASFADITEQRAAVARALVRERLGGVAHLAGRLAHEFANALTVVQARHELLRARATDATVEDLEAAQLAILRATELTDALRALGGREAVSLREVDLVALLPSIVADLNATEPVRLALVRGVTSDEAATPIRVRVDAGLLRRVLSTIVSSCRTERTVGDELPFSLQAERIDLTEPLVEVHGELAAGRWALVRCRCASGGLSDDALASLTAPDYAQRHAQLGAGVDLPVALARMQRMGGHLSARRIGTDGSEVVLWLPLLVAAEGTASAASVPEATSADVTLTAATEHDVARSRTRRTPWIASVALAAMADPPALDSARDLTGLRVLLVDDDPLVLRTAERLLQRVGCVVTTATGGDAAAALLDAGAPAIDLLVTDVVMPGLSGPALVARLRARGDGRPVVYMSGYTGDAFSAAAELDEDAILVAKPFTTATLVGAMREALGATGTGR